MSRKVDVRDNRESHNDSNIQRVKAAAWAWYQHGGGQVGGLVRSEANIRRRVPLQRFSRFKREAIKGKASRRHSFESWWSRKSSSSNDLNSMAMDLDENGEWLSNRGSSLFDSVELDSMCQQLANSWFTDKLAKGPQLYQSPQAHHHQPKAYQRIRIPFQKVNLFQPSLCHSTEVISSIRRVDRHSSYSSSDSITGQEETSRQGHPGSKLDEQKPHNRESELDEEKPHSRLSSAFQRLAGSLHFNREKRHQDRHGQEKHLHQHHYHFYHFHLHTEQTPKNLSKVGAAGLCTNGSPESMVI